MRKLSNKFVSENDQDKLLYSLNECQIKQNGNIDQTYLNNYIHKNYNINVLSLSTINMINEKLASNLIEYRFKSQKKKTIMTKCRNYLVYFCLLIVPAAILITYEYSSARIMSGILFSAGLFFAYLNGLKNQLIVKEIIKKLFEF